MRVAFSGAHATGKTTLIAELARRLPQYAVVEESYHTLLAEGHAFAAKPTLDDFELMLDRSCATLSSATAADLLMDRCPADYLGYLFGGEGANPHALRDAMGRAATAMTRLDLVVFVPIEHPDRIDRSAIGLPRLRRRVDDALREIILDGSLGLGTRAIEVSGTVDERVEQVLLSFRGEETRALR
jgi:hypothetical protein